MGTSGNDNLTTLKDFAETREKARRNENQN